MAEIISQTEEINLPVVPLRGMVAFPSVPMSIEVAREKSIGAIRVAERLGGCIMLIAQTDVSVDKPTPDNLYRVGTVAKIKQSVKTAEGGVRVLLEGRARAEVTSYTQNDKFISALVRPVDEPAVPADSGVYREALMRQAHAALDRVVELMPKISDEMIFSAKMQRDPGLLADFIAANIIVKYEDKQAVLEQFDPLHRLADVLTILESEEEILRCEMDIHKKVRARLDQNQRDFYLREQVKVIQNELGDDGDSEIDEFFDRIEEAHLPKEVEDKLIKETNRLAKTPYGSAESTVLHNYLDECLDIPFGKYSETECDIKRAEAILERDHEGLHDVKERILDFLAATKFSGKKGGQIICLVGPPGVGKTSIAASIAEALGRKYVRVSLGGVRDEADIRGHRKTYVGAMPGRIVYALQHAGVMNPLILLDEVDKLVSDAHGDPASALLEVLDSEQNKAFRDHFVEIPIDLSECFFLATANTLETVPRPLIDRMEVIELGAYTRTEKLNIAKTHLIPKQMKLFGIDKKQLTITQSAVAELIDYYTAEAGVRTLERMIAALCRKAAKRIADDPAAVLSVTPATLEELLGPRKYKPEEDHRDDEIGVVNGLAWTAVGGTTMPVEVAVLDGSGKIELTGNLGDVMKESAKIAVTYVRSRAKDWHIDGDFYKKKDIHIHVPEGAVPKDGPSAGVTMATAIVSALTGIPVRGDVMPIGGLREKSMAAYTHHMHTVVIPEDNRPDLAEIDPVVREHTDFVTAKCLDTVLHTALLSDPGAARPSVAAGV